MSTEAVIGGSGERVRSSGLPRPGWRSRSVAVPPVAVLASRIAWRSEPGPLSAVVVTTNDAVGDHELRLRAGHARRLGLERKAGEALGPGERIDHSMPWRRIQGRERAAVGERSGPIARARSGRRCSTATAPRPRPRASGPKSVRSGPAIGILQVDDVAGRARARRPAIPGRERRGDVGWRYLQA